MAFEKLKRKEGRRERKRRGGQKQGSREERRGKEGTSMESEVL